MGDFLNTLSAEDITSILSNTKTRGQTLETLTTFVASDKLYAVINEMPQYKGKDKGQLTSIRNQLTMKAKEKGINVKLAKKDDNILIVNMDKLAEQDSE